jgi:hypothetical protein
MGRVVVELSVLSIIMGISCKRTVYKVPSESETNSILILHVAVCTINTITYYIMYLTYICTCSLVDSEFFKVISFVRKERN